MADEIPPAPSETEDASKAETIRITLPPRQEQQAIKRETVRISLPGKPSSVPPTGIAPKKESTKLGAATDAAPAAPRSFTPPSAPSAPAIPPAKPLPGMAPPKPPTFGARPTVPLKPAPAPGAGPTPAPASAPAPLAQRAAAPKKETARITLPPEGAAKPALPKATVKMQQTQPLVNRPAPSITPASPVTTSALSAGHLVVAEADSTANMMSIVALVVSVFAFGLVFWAYSAASL